MPNAALVRALSQEMAPTIRRFVSDAITPLVDRIKVLEARPVPPGITGGIKNSDGLLILTLSNGETIATGLRDGVDGKDGAPGRDGAPGENGKDGSNGQDGENGKDFDPEAFREIVEKEIKVASDALAGFVRGTVDEAVQGIPVPKDGQSPDPQEIITLVRAVVASLPPAKDGAPGRDGIDGKDGVDGKDGAPGIDGRDGAPGADGRDGAPGIDGKDGAPGADGRDGAPGTDGIHGKDGAPGAPGRDGVGLAGAMIDRSGHLVLTLADGRTMELGVIVGKDGVDGAPGRDGVDGAPGRDGLGFDDLEVTFEGRTLSIGLLRDGISKVFNFPVPVVIDRGVWKSGVAYEKGDGVSHGGSFWIAQADTTEKPEMGRDWRLAVKRGRDGKDGERGPPGPPGPSGEKR